MRDRGILLVGVALLALSSVVVKWLTEISDSLKLDREAISFCNVLFVGNFAAGLLLAFRVKPTALKSSVSKLSTKHRLLLFASVAFAVLIPCLIFTALARTNVANVILLGRFESVAFAFFGTFMGGASLAGRQKIGLSVIAIGTLSLVVMQGQFMAGDALIISAAILQGLAAHFAKPLLIKMNLIDFMFIRNACSAVAFFLFAMIAYGPIHFADAFGPQLWLVMTVYALIVVVFGQFAWYYSVAKLPSTTVSMFSMWSPFFGLTFAWLLLSSIPSGLQAAGGSIILVGMLISRASKATAKETEQGVNATVRDGLSGI